MVCSVAVSHSHHRSRSAALRWTTSLMEVVQELPDAPKLKRQKKSHRFGYEDLDPRNVRPGETRDQSTVRKLGMHSMPGFPTYLFQACAAARVHFCLWLACCRASHNETPPTGESENVQIQAQGTIFRFSRIYFSRSARPCSSCRVHILDGDLGKLYRTMGKELQLSRIFKGI